MGDPAGFAARAACLIWLTCAGNEGSEQCAGRRSGRDGVGVLRDGALAGRLPGSCRHHRAGPRHLQVGAPLRRITCVSLSPRKWYH